MKIEGRGTVSPRPRSGTFIARVNARCTLRARWRTPEKKKGKEKIEKGPRGGGRRGVKREEVEHAHALSHPVRAISMEVTRRAKWVSTTWLVCHGVLVAE